MPEHPTKILLPCLDFLLNSLAFKRLEKDDVSLPVDREVDVVEVALDLDLLDVETVDFLLLAGGILGWREGRCYKTKATDAAQFFGPFFLLVRTKREGEEDEDGWGGSFAF